MSAMSDWQVVLKRLNDAILTHRDRSSLFKTVPETTRWLGFEGASLNVIDELEQRLQCTLPPSYRQFLLLTNGWGPIDEFVWRMLPAEQVGWHRDKHPELVEAVLAGTDDAKRQGFAAPLVPDEKYFVYGPAQSSLDTRDEYLPEMLQVSDIGDATVVLLNPLIRNDEGEWEAWWSASWLPGAKRYRSFFDLISDRLRATEAT